MQAAGEERPWEHPTGCRAAAATGKWAEKRGEPHSDPPRCVTYTLTVSQRLPCPESRPTGPLRVCTQLPPLSCLDTGGGGGGGGGRTQVGMRPLEESLWTRMSLPAAPELGTLTPQHGHVVWANSSSL